MNDKKKPRALTDRRELVFLYTPVIRNLWCLPLPTFNLTFTMMRRRHSPPI